MPDNTVPTQRLVALIGFVVGAALAIAFVESIFLARLGHGLWSFRPQRDFNYLAMAVICAASLGTVAALAAVRLFATEEPSEDC